MKRVVIIFIIILSLLGLLYAQEAGDNVRSLLSSEGKIFYGDEPNSVLVIDYPQNIQRFADYLEAMDVAPLQVHIEARIVEVRLQEEHSLGINWSLFSEKGGLDLRRALDLTAVKLYGSTVGSALSQEIPYKSTYYPPGQIATGEETPFTMTIFDENINVVLQALSNALKTDILFAPSITTVNNREAEIRIIQDLPWAEPQSDTSDSGIVTVSWTMNFDKQSGIKLSVIPTINEDGKIAMTLKPEISEKIGDYTVNATGVIYTIPIIDTRIASTKVVVGNGQTLIIGGLIKDKVIEGETKIPLLGDIPFLGHFFKSEKITKDKTELLIFVSPTIITPEEFVRMKQQKRYGVGGEFIREKEKEPRLIQKKQEDNKFIMDLSLLEEEQNLILK